MILIDDAGALRAKSIADAEKGLITTKRIVSGCKALGHRIMPCSDGRFS